MKKKLIKVKQIKETVLYNGIVYVYVLGENGRVYFIKHKPETNEAVWTELSQPHV